MHIQEPYVGHRFHNSPPPPPSPRNCPESAEAYDTMIMIMADHEGFEGRGVRGKALPIYQFKLVGSYEGLKRDLK